MNKKIIISVIVLVILILLISLFAILHNTHKEDNVATITIYNKLIDDALSKYDTKKYNYISIAVKDMFDPLTGKYISDQVKKGILQHSSKYNSTIDTKNRNELDKVQETGLCISIRLIYTKNKEAQVKVQVYVLNSEDNERTFTYELQYDKNQWQNVLTNSTIGVS